jgi:phenylacetate-CoA ligase
MTERQVQLLVDLQADAILVTPSYALSILDEMRRRASTPAAPAEGRGLRRGAVDRGDAREVEDAFAIHAVDIYGLSEVIGPGVANECVETKDGLHVWEDHFYPEVDRSGDRRGAPRRRGGRAGVHLPHQGGDADRPLPHPRPHPAAARHRPHDAADGRITGRSDDLIILRGVNLFPSQIEELLLDVDGLAPHFECVLTRPDRLDRLTVRVEARDGQLEREVERGEAARRLQRRVKARIGVSVEVEVVDPAVITRSIGKAKRIVDRRSR